MKAKVLFDALKECFLKDTHRHGCKTYPSDGHHGFHDGVVDYDSTHVARAPQAAFDAQARTDQAMDSKQHQPLICKSR